MDSVPIDSWCPEVPHWSHSLCLKAKSKRDSLDLFWKPNVTLKWGDVFKIGDEPLGFWTGTSDWVQHRPWITPEQPRSSLLNTQCSAVVYTGSNWCHFPAYQWVCLRTALQCGCSFKNWTRETFIQDVYGPTGNRLGDQMIQVPKCQIRLRSIAGLLSNIRIGRNCLDLNVVVQVTSLGPIVAGIGLSHLLSLMTPKNLL